MKILIAADMEGISGVTNWDQVTPGHFEYTRFRVIMTDDINATIAGAFEGGASEVIITDGHDGGTNILIDHLDHRASLNAGNASPYAMVQGIESGDFDGVIFVGYHARSGSANGILAHTWSSRKVARVWLNQVEMGEYGINGALCGYFGTPILMITGDQTTCEQGSSLLGDLETVNVKRATSFSSAECLPPAVAQERIHAGARKAIQRLREGKGPSPFKVTQPVKGIIDFQLVEMADSACRLPGANRLDGTSIEFIASDMPTAYITFRAAVALA